MNYELGIRCAFALSGFILILIINAYIDKDEIEDGIYIKHWSESAIILFIGAIISLISFWFQRYTIFAFILFMPFRWLFFDLYLNFIRGEKLDYIGELKPTSSLTDKFLHKVGKWQYLIKIAAFISAIYIDFYLNFLINKYL